MTISEPLKYVTEKSIRFADAEAVEFTLANEEKEEHACKDQ